MGCKHRATAKIVLIFFSASPTHLEVISADESEINVEFIWLAIALPTSVFPVPGGPNSKIPLAGVRSPT